MSDVTKIVRFPDQSAIEAEAAEWIARRFGGDLPADEEARFQEWLTRSAAHRDAMARLSGLWSELQSLEALAPAVADERPIRTWPFSTWSPAWRVPRRFIAYASALIVTVLVIDLALNRVATENVAATYETPVGAQKKVSLPDGSGIVLNTGSLVDVHYTWRKRDIRLVRGEAYFEVAPNKNRPFSVFAGGGLVRAVGTAFAVHLVKDSVDVTVTKGVVELAALASPGTSTNQAIERKLGRISAGENAVFSDRLEHLEKRSDADLYKDLAWRNGVLVLVDKPLDEVVDEIGRYTTVNIEIADPRLNGLRVGGYFEVGKVDAVLDALQAGFGVRVEWVDPAHVRLSLPR